MGFHFTFIYCLFFHCLFLELQTRIYKELQTNSSLLLELQRIANYCKLELQTIYFQSYKKKIYTSDRVMKTNYTRVSLSSLRSIIKLMTLVCLFVGFVVVAQ
jgi:hypothetical protein